MGGVAGLIAAKGVNPKTNGKGILNNRDCATALTHQTLLTADRRFYTERAKNRIVCQCRSSWHMKEVPKVMFRLASTLENLP